MNLLVCQDKNVECDTTVSRLQISAFLEWFSGCHHWAKSPLGKVVFFFFAFSNFHHTRLALRNRLQNRVKSFFFKLFYVGKWEKKEEILKSYYVFFFQSQHFLTLFFKIRGINKSWAEKKQGMKFQQLIMVWGEKIKKIKNAERLIFALCCVSISTTSKFICFFMLQCQSFYWISFLIRESL